MMDRLGKVPSTREQFVWEAHRFEVIVMWKRVGLDTSLLFAAVCEPRVLSPFAS
jgi:hypothetical protein